MKYYAIVGIFESFLKLAVAFACVYTTFDKLIVYGSLMACIPLITLTVMRVHCHRHYEECVISPRTYWNKGLMREMTSFAGWNFIGTLSSIVSQYGLSIVLNHFWGTLLNTAQGIANQISGQLMVFSNTMLKALSPVIVKSKGSHNDSLMQKATFLGCKYAYFMLALFAIPFILETPFILKIWLKTIPDWAVVFCQLQLLRSIIEQLTISIGTMISAQGQIKQYSIYKSILGIIPIIFTAVFYYFKYPPYTMYIIWIFCGGILGGYMSLYYANHLCKTKYIDYFKSVFFPCLVPTILSVIIGYIIQKLYIESFLRLCLTISLTTTILFLCYLLTSSKEEQLLIKGLITKICIQIKLKK